jgi:hypothetical protein
MQFVDDTEVINLLEDYCLLWTGRHLLCYIVTDVSNELAASIFMYPSVLNVETARFSEKLVMIYQTTWRHNPENGIPRSSYDENFRTQVCLHVSAGYVYIRIRKQGSTFCFRN